MLAHGLSLLQDISVYGNQLNGRINATYHLDVVDNDGINMGTTVFICDIECIMNDMRVKPKLLNSFYHAHCISQSVNKQDGALSKRLHLGECRIQIALVDLRHDSKVELASSSQFALDPHVTLHEGYKSLRD